MSAFTSGDAQKLLHNKFVVVLGDSIQRSVYKDLVMLLQHDSYLTEGQLKRKGEMTFENDTLVEGGQLNEMHNGVEYREVRQYRTGHHLVRFYFLTRVYSMYLESVLADFTAGPQPDVLIINSCFWDLTRYTSAPMKEYKANLQKLFSRLTKALSPECLILWNMTMPGGYKDAEMPQHIKYNLKWDVVEGNFYSASFASLYNIDVLDMHYHFRLDLQRRCRDAIHWDQLAHRKYTQLLLAHIAQGWGVEAPRKKGVSDHHDQAVPRRKAARKRRKPSLPIQHGAKEVQMSLSIPCPEYVKVNGDCDHFACDIYPQPGFFCPGYVSFEMNHRGDAAGVETPRAVPSVTGTEQDLFYCPPNGPNHKLHEPWRPHDRFVPDSPWPAGAMMAANHSFDGHSIERKGPPGSHHLFHGMDMDRNVVPDQYFPAMPFGSFAPHRPIPPDCFRGPHRNVMKIPYLRPRLVRMHPYPWPPVPPPRFY